MDEIIAKAKEYALSEIEKYGVPIPDHFALTEKVGKSITQKLGANEKIVLIGVYLMDLKLGEAIKEGKQPEHTQISSDASKEFLAQFDMEKDALDKVINCVEAHHGAIPYKCIEAEICANADCYRFVHPRGFLAAFTLFGRIFDKFDDSLDAVEKKLEEKHSILSLDICKEELEPHYRRFKDLITQARQKG